MSLTLITNPVITEGGVKKNIFAGFRPVEYVFKREDLAIASVGESSGDIQITIATDLTTYLEVGDFIYLYAPGISGTYEYNVSAEITAITSTTITLDAAFIETASSGYINYLKNYYVDLELTEPTNTSIKKIPFSLKDDGIPAGNITVDVSIANDKNKELFELSTHELTEGRIQFDVRYREVSLGVTGSWTELNDPVILVTAWEQMETEEIINDFDLPKLYKGYPFGVVASHSDQNGSDSFVGLFYDELDINQNDVVTGTPIGQLDLLLYGMLFYYLPNSQTFESNTKFINIYGNYTNLPDYDSAGYASPDYSTT